MIKLSKETYKVAQFDLPRDKLKMRLAFEQGLEYLNEDAPRTVELTKEQSDELCKVEGYYKKYRPT